MNRLLLTLIVSSCAATLASCGGGSSSSVTSSPAAVAAGSRVKALAAGTRETSVAVSPYRVPVDSATVVDRIDRRLSNATGTVEVWVSLAQNSVSAQRAALVEAEGMSNRDRTAIRASSRVRAGVASHRQLVRAEQSRLSSDLTSIGAKEIGRVQSAHNAIAVSVDGAKLKQIAALAGVAKVRPVIHYSLELAETVPYVGGAAVQTRGFDGTGVKVAVLDSGIDYTHRNLGGAGTAAAYAAAYGAGPSDSKNTSRDGLFPTAKVVGGYDFVGEQWPNGPRTEDDDPIDYEGHGTHVADIIAGRSVDGLHKGVAPGAKLVAVKVCSAVSSICNGVALLKGMDYAIDPNGDGDLSDGVDVINLSLGSAYGQIEDDLTLAVSNAVNLGVVVVAAAGNGGNKPFILDSPALAPGAIAVAQTQVPSAKAYPLVVNAPAAIAGIYGNTESVSWAPIDRDLTGNVVFVGRGCPGDPLLANPAGKIALIDRGACSVSLKVDSAASAGATGVLIGLVASGDAIPFSYGGGATFVPTLVIQQSLSRAIKAQLAATTVSVSIAQSAAISLVGSMVSSSSRGPTSLQTIKPEIGAPGASVSAQAGTGTAETPFGGTSGATPMVAGAAALLLQAHPDYAPIQIKSALMNSAETAIYTNPATLPGSLAPITRIGAGELRVNRALDLQTLAYDPKNLSAALSFGALEVMQPITVKRTLIVKNLSRSDKRYAVTPSFRYVDDQASGAVRVNVASSLQVDGKGSEELEVELSIDPSKLPAWNLNSGSLGGNGAALNGPEYDGYITLTAGSEKVSVPWHVLPRKAAATSAEVSDGRSGPVLALRNGGAESGEFDVFSLTGVSPKIPTSSLPKPGDNFAVIDLRAVGVRYLPASIYGADYIEFAINTAGRRATANVPAEFDIYIDVNGDGVPDYVVYNGELGGFGATGQNAVFVSRLGSGTATAAFYSDVDFNSSNVIMTVPMAALGLAPGTTIGFEVDAVDIYFTGNLTDSITGNVFTPGSARYSVASGSESGAVPAKGGAQVAVQKARVSPTTSSEQGILLMYRRNAGQEAQAIRLR